MFGNLDYPRREWFEHGIHYIEIGIPGEKRRGVLTREALASMRQGQKPVLPLGKEAMDEDLTTEPIREESFLIPRGEKPIPVTSYCLKSRMGTLKPAVVYFHGGGFRMGSRKTVKNSMRLLAQLSGGIVFSVEYRLAPEYRFPCATDDAWQALRWLSRNAGGFEAEKNRFFVSGDSAGGNLAAACTRRDRNMRTGLIHSQLLIYPVLCQMEPQIAGYHFSLEDYEINPEQEKWIASCILSMKNATAGTRLYTSNVQEDISPDASPLLDKNFAGLPKTVLFCGEFDYLTQQARAYAERLAESGTDVTLILYRGVHHGFMNRLGEYPQATALHLDLASFIQKTYNQ